MTLLYQHIKSPNEKVEMIACKNKKVVLKNYIPILRYIHAITTYCVKCRHGVGKKRKIWKNIGENGKVLF